MTHLDLGFTNSTRNVCDTYFDTYFPAAAETATKLKQMRSKAEFSWTEFPWIIQEYLDGAAGCAHRRRTPNEIKLMEEMIANETVIWQANAVNFLTEVLDPDLWDYSLRMKDVLNAKYGKSWGNLAGKLSDTTGMSRAAIPGLAKRGIKGFHIGYNGVGGLPEVIPTFMWKDLKTGTELLTMIEADYGKEVELPPQTASSIVRSQTGVALVFLFTLDNSGPPTAEQVDAFWTSLQKKNPNAEILRSSLDAFTAEALKQKDSLPQYTIELGDSWLYGAPADPIKVSTFRAARRVLKGSNVSSSNPLYDSYMRRLMKGPCEHNWGYSVGNFLPELRTPTNWDNVGFNSVRGDLRYLVVEQEWAEQREWMHPLPSWSSLNGWSHGEKSNARRTNAIIPTQQQAAEWIPVVSRLEEQMIPLMYPTRPESSNFPKKYDFTPLQCGRFRIQLNKTDGSVSSLVDIKNSINLSKGGSDGLGKVTYVSYSDEDFQTFASEYAGGDFGKAGMSSADPDATSWFTTVKDAKYSGGEGAHCSILVQLALPHEAVKYYGAAAEIYLKIDVTDTVAFSYSWFGKTATRLAESFWVSWNVRSQSNAKWMMDVMGQPIDPLDVVRGGTLFKHFVNQGVSLKDQNGTTTVNFIDTGLVGVGDVNHLLHFCRERGWGGTANCNQTNPVKGGMHANLHNNLWGTAFPQWYDDDGSARFVITRTN